MTKPWITFEVQPIDAKKTRTWTVKTLAGVRLGVVKWFAPWRQYSFFPDAGTAWERECLRTVAEFCERSTDNHRAILKARKP
jgi:phenylpropionate dioxygenase-like ring-hydroxylating dioxygenase large terminal subunit